MLLCALGRGGWGCPDAEPERTSFWLFKASGNSELPLNCQVLVRPSVTRELAFSSQEGSILDGHPLDLIQRASTLKDRISLA